MEELTEMEVIKMNLKYNHVKWFPNHSLEFRAAFYKKAEKEAEELGFSFLGDKDFKVIGEFIYLYPIFEDNNEEPVDGSLIKLIPLPD